MSRRWGLAAGAVVVVAGASVFAVATSKEGYAAPGTGSPVSIDRTCQKTAKNQIELDECAVSEFTQVQGELAAALKTESKLLGQKSTMAVEEEWTRFRSDDCTLRAKINIGGSIYPLVYLDCEVGLTITRVEEIRTYDAEYQHGGV
jgi:uncharacterized protein YecT (DUF1311 family)